MASDLQSLDELPADFRRALDDQQLAPLWPSMRHALPLDRPISRTRAFLWSYQKVRPLLLQTGRLAPIERAERRVLVLCDPGRGKGALQATPTIYAGLQLLLPGEQAPSHRHTPSAARLVVEGEGAFTVVDGSRCVMRRGDVILTPGGCWHEHGHGGEDPFVWLDALDLPLFTSLEASYAETGERRNRPPEAAPSTASYAHAGLRRPHDVAAARPRYPMLRYPWEETEAALRQLAEETLLGTAVELAYVNPETGESCLATLGFTAMMLRPGEQLSPPLRSASALFHAIGGSGTSTIDGVTFAWSAADTLSAPAFAKIRHRAGEGGPAFLMRIDDAPLQRRLNFYEERSA